MTPEEALDAIAEAVVKCRADNERHHGDTAEFELTLLMASIEAYYEMATGRKI